MRNEDIIMRYCVQIRRPFCIQDIADNCDIDKSIVFSVIHRFSRDGMIERICDTARPKLYRWKVALPAKRRNQPSYETLRRVKPYIGRGKTHAEIAEELGISRSSVSMAMRALNATPEIDREKCSANLYLQRQKLRVLLKKHNIELDKAVRDMSLLEIKEAIERIKYELLDRSSV